MPTYQYACKDCGERLEVVQKFSDEPLTECPHCHGPLRKVFSSVGVVFKGSGFYKTDSRASAASASSTGSSSTGSGDGGGSTGSGSGSGDGSTGSSAPASASTASAASSSSGDGSKVA